MHYKNYDHKDDFFKDVLKEIRREVYDLSKADLLNINEDEFLNYLCEKYCIEPLQIYKELNEVQEPKKISQKVENPYEAALYGRRNGIMVYEGYQIDVEYPYSGDTRLFFVRPSSFSIGGANAEIRIDDIRNKLILTFKCWDMDPSKFNSDKEHVFDSKLNHYLAINKDVENFNGNLRTKIQGIYNERRNECLKENEFFKAINVKAREEKSKIELPLIKKKIIQKPSIKGREYETYPSMAESMYEDIIKTFNDIGQSWERHPSIYLGKDEEALRDLFLSHLTIRYDGFTTTAETFNFGGKTDIIVKDPVSKSNIFIAECKFWKGQKAFSSAINQLFDRYLTVRDSKVALIFFVNGNEFNTIIETIKREVATHPYYITFKGSHNKSSLSYIFHLPSDKNQKINLEIMAFHFPKNVIETEKQGE
ncbi:MAG: hypothetical protein J1F31_06665 [Erysipelotrichales bacterium]|nr:hypothetical protein [Erysipelotrichales bacterium]